MPRQVRVNGEKITERRKNTVSLLVKLIAIFGVPLLTVGSGMAVAKYKIDENKNKIVVLTKDTGSVEDRVLTIEKELPLQLDNIRQSVDAINTRQEKFEVKQEQFQGKLLDKLDRIIMNR